MATKQKQKRKSRKTQIIDQKPKLDERFITVIQGKEFVVYAGLLDLAHQKGLLKLDVEPIQYPTPENGMEAICRAVAESKDGEIFSDIGDANPNNVHPKVVKHLLRICSTRAKARALRDMTNIGMTAIEELGDLDEVIGNEISKQTEAKNNGSKSSEKSNGNGNGKSEAEQGKTAAKKNGSKQEEDKKDKSAKQKESKAEPPQPTKSEPSPQSKGSNGNKNTSRISEAQKRAIYNLGNRKGLSAKELEAMATKIYNRAIEHMSSSDASSFIRELQSKAA